MIQMAITSIKKALMSLEVTMIVRDYTIQVRATNMSLKICLTTMMMKMT
jgi:hypothetical protein